MDARPIVSAPLTNTLQIQFYKTMKILKPGILGLLFVAITGNAQATQIIGPLPYLSEADSPFDSNNALYFHLENFEDEVLNTPGVSVNGSWKSRNSNYSDSIDGDDGVIDGDGSDGVNFSSEYAEQAATFTFDQSALGGVLPTFAGVVWTDIGKNGGGSPTGKPKVRFKALDANGVLIAQSRLVELGDRLITGQTEEDRFFGVVYPGGISSITLEMPGYTNWGLDHLQYGAHSVPAPSPNQPIGSVQNASVLEWTGSPNATWYYLYVDDDSGARERRWITATQAGCAGTGQGCNWPSPISSQGTVDWWVRAWDSVSGPWSIQASYSDTSSAAPRAAVPVWPVGNYTRIAPTFVWKAVPGATWDQLWIQKDSDGSYTADWYLASATGCADGTGTCEVETTNNLSSAHIWWVQPWSQGGYGPWSTGFAFSD